VNVPMIRTWKQQQAFERTARTKWLQQMADTGKPICVCAPLFGIPQPSLSNMAISHGITFVKSDYKKPEQVTKAKLENCLSKGLTTAASARALGVSEAAIYQGRKRHGIVLTLHQKFQK
tara:strand:+ start:677 stop:1033 length:357 start_codon:yes stop_codon:yes gene_type:complete